MHIYYDLQAFGENVGVDGGEGGDAEFPFQLNSDVICVWNLPSDVPSGGSIVWCGRG